MEKCRLSYWISGFSLLLWLCLRRYLNLSMPTTNRPTIATGSSHISISHQCEQHIQQLLNVIHNRTHSFGLSSPVSLSLSSLSLCDAKNNLSIVMWLLPSLDPLIVLQILHLQHGCLYVFFFFIVKAVSCNRVFFPKIYRPRDDFVLERTAIATVQLTHWRGNEFSSLMSNRIIPSFSTLNSMWKYWSFIIFGLNFHHNSLEYFYFYQFE